MDRMRPLEKQNLMALATALGSGLDPNVAMGYFGDTVGGYQQRVAERDARLAAIREERNASLRMLEQQAMELAGQGVPYDVAQTYLQNQIEGVRGYEPGLPAVQRAQSGLSGLMGELYPEGEGLSTIAPPELVAAQGGQDLFSTVDDEDRTAIMRQVENAYNAGLDRDKTLTALTQSLSQNPAVQWNEILASQVNQIVQNTWSRLEAMDAGSWDPTTKATQGGPPGYGASLADAVSQIAKESSVPSMTPTTGALPNFSNLSGGQNLFDTGLNQSNTGWQDLFGLFPGLFRNS